MKTRNMIGPRTVHWGTPHVTGTDGEEVPCMTTVCVLSDNNALIQFIMSFWIPYNFSLNKINQFPFSKTEKLDSTCF